MRNSWFISTEKSPACERQRTCKVFVCTRQCTEPSSPFAGAVCSSPAPCNPRLPDHLHLNTGCLDGSMAAGPEHRWELVTSCSSQTWQSSAAASAPARCTAQAEWSRWEVSLHMRSSLGPGPNTRVQWGSTPCAPGGYPST